MDKLKNFIARFKKSLKPNVISDTLVIVAFLIAFVTTLFINVYVAFYMLSAFTLICSYLLGKK